MTRSAFSATSFASRVRISGVRSAVTLRKMKAPLTGLTMENRAGKPSRKALMASCISRRSAERRALVRPRLNGLERRRGLQDTEVVETPADDLQPDRQAVAGKAARYAGRRIPGHVEGVGEL